MQSGGETMGIGRSFEEAFQDAVHMSFGQALFLDTCKQIEVDDFLNALKHATDRRVFSIAVALKMGITVEKIHAVTKIDPWFLYRLLALSNAHTTLEQMTFDVLTPELVRKAKIEGFSDFQISSSLCVEETAVRNFRFQNGILPCFKAIDTVSAEFPSRSNYFYSTYLGDENDAIGGLGGVIILGAGPYSVGCSLEFDWSVVHFIKTLQSAGRRVITINCNPGTMSTDHDLSDVLYFEEISLEKIIEIYRFEAAEGIILCAGGQAANNLTPHLEVLPFINVLGTPLKSIDRAEDRMKFSSLVDSLSLRQTPWAHCVDPTELETEASKIGFPCLVRPSYVLSGASMKVVHDLTHLTRFFQNAVEVSTEYPVCISKYVEGAIEVDFDAVAVSGSVLICAISQHVENAGVHSGDATLIVPPQIDVSLCDQIASVGCALAKSLEVSGPMNVQIMVKDCDVLIIECNLRCSRTFPFISMAYGYNFARLACAAVLGSCELDSGVFLHRRSLPYYAVKVPKFSFDRLPGSEPITGVEMMSTGEVACFGDTLAEAYVKANCAANGLGSAPKSLLILNGSTKDLSNVFRSVLSLGVGLTRIYVSRNIDQAVLADVPFNVLSEEDIYLRLLDFDLVLSFVSSSSPFVTTTRKRFAALRTAVICTAEVFNHYTSAVLEEPSLHCKASVEYTTTH